MVSGKFFSFSMRDKKILLIRKNLKFGIKGQFWVNFLKFLSWHSICILE